MTSLTNIEGHTPSVEDADDRSRPLVSVGVPVRNGGKLLEHALQTVIAQTHDNLEIIISDNCSTDETPRICRRFGERDSRIRYVRQETLLTAFQNFEFLVRESTGEYFLWVAHDDLRSENYVATLLAKLVERPDAVLAFGDLRLGNPEAGWRPCPEFDFSNDDLSVLRRLKKTANRTCYHFYGLWRAGVLKSLKLYNTYFWPDLPVLMAACGFGTFVHAPGASFCYYEVHKTNEQRIRQDYGKSKKRFLIARVTLATFWIQVRVGRPLLAAPSAWYVFSARFRSWLNIEVRGFFYRISPEPVRRAWRKLKQAVTQASTP
jgi:glycosyltransferase involved in cell wall biosynthesis